MDFPSNIYVLVEPSYKLVGCKLYKFTTEFAQYIGANNVKYSVHRSFFDEKGLALPVNDQCDRIGEGCRFFVSYKLAEETRDTILREMIASAYSVYSSLLDISLETRKTFYMGVE